MTWKTLPRSELGGLSAVDVGKGHPVVLLHGVGLRAEAWKAQIYELQRAYRVIAPDMPGHGESSPTTGPMTLDDYTRACMPFVEELPEPAMVIGHSMGSMIALELAARAASKVCAVVALNAIFQRSPEAAASVQLRSAGLDETRSPDPTSTLLRWFGDRKSPERSACETWLREVDPKSYKLAYSVFAHATGPSRAALQTLACPALFATGALEPNSTPDMSRAMATLAPQGRALIVEGAAHMMPMTHADEVNTAITDLAREVWP